MIGLCIGSVIVTGAAFMGWIAWVGPQQADRDLRAAWRKVRASIAGAAQ